MPKVIEIGGENDAEPKGVMLVAGEREQIEIGKGEAGGYRAKYSFEEAKVRATDEDDPVNTGGLLERALGGITISSEDATVKVAEGLTLEIDEAVSLAGDALVIPASVVGPAVLSVFTRGPFSIDEEGPTPPPMYHPV